MIAAEQHARNTGPLRDTPVHEVDVTLDLTDLTGFDLSSTRVTFALQPAAAKHLAEQLDIAAETPRQCDRCHRYVEKPSSLTDLCGTCQEREDAK